jgi:glycosyltransferase involved in cell wall biosynthesis
MSRKLISIVTPTYNEAENIWLLIEAIHKEMLLWAEVYDYELIVIDNGSTDDTVAIVKAICNADKRVKLIVNSRNFGHIRSPFHGLLQAKGDAVLFMASDFQDPVELISQHIANWEKGFKISIAVKNKAEESWVFYNIRKTFYKLIGRLSETKLIENYTGTGLYDQYIVNVLRKMDDPYPYFRGMISEVGFEKAIVNFTQPRRKRGFTKNNFYTLYDMAMLGITSYSKVPLRIATMLGFVMSAVSLLVALVYLVLKLFFWFNFPAGIAPMVIGIFFLSSVQLFFIGVLGEYIGSIHTLVQKRPLVIEQERVNFDQPEKTDTDDRL